MQSTLTVTAVRSALASHRHKENAYFMSKYMKNRFPFFGIKTPLRKKILNELIQEHALTDKTNLFAFIKNLWSEPEREFQSIACDLLLRNIRNLETSDLPFLVSLATEKSWWDTVDTLSPRIIGPILLKEKSIHKSISNDWISSSNFWVQRIALLYQLKWKSETNAEHLFALVRHASHEKEFFIRKAIGWILREYSRTDADAVINFVEETELSTLSRREALKLLNKR